MKKILSIFALAGAFAGMMTSCDDLFEPAVENVLGLEHMYVNAGYAEGVLANGYISLPTGDLPWSEAATDDAVCNTLSGGDYGQGVDYRKLAEGSWSSSFNPTDRWARCRSGIMYMNLFLANADNVHWANDAVAAALYNVRLKAEAYAMRGIFMYYLLQAHAGYDNDGQLLGVPVVTEPEGVASNFNVPRNTFKECMEQMYNDFDEALKVLPDVYVDVDVTPSQFATVEVPEKGNQTVSPSTYNRVFGHLFDGRISGQIVKAFRSKAALMAASPAYADSQTATWEQAANYSAQVLNAIDWYLDPTGNTWYRNTADIEALEAYKNVPEVMWRGGIDNGNSLEKAMYPPQQWGAGRINPTQNFVDAFPMADGTPINESADYDDANPYENRDPRLALYVVLNGSKVGDATINTQSDADGINGLNKEQGYSTRTGYYLRKHLREDVNLNPNNTTTQKHYTPRIRYTEMFLNYAEAANEAWGPTGKGSNRLSAYDVIKAIRERAGIVGDSYLEQCKGSKDKMRELIRNERRIELSFEGFRFWDLRRWKSPLNTEVKIINITGGENKSYSVTTIPGALKFEDYQYYGPIPYSEVLKYNALQQNKGWK